MIKYFKIPDGYFANCFGHLGCIDAYIYRPNDCHKGIWRVCFAQCTGEGYDLIGKVQDFKTLEAAKARLSYYDGWMNAMDTPIPGYRGLPCAA